jgi:acetyl esterase/lipase
MKSFTVRILTGPALLSLTATLLASSNSVAQDASQYYTIQHPAEFKINWKEFYRDADARTAAVRAKLPHTLDLPYGPDVKQRLDVYGPTTKPQHAPVFVFLHGGGFREGDRANYGYVAAPFAAKGIVTVMPSYHLTGSGSHYPVQADDIRLAIKWVYQHIAEFGGDPNRIVVGGHSAGAILAADVGVNRGWMKAAGIPAEALRGFAPISGPYDLRVDTRPGELDAYAPSLQAREQASPLLHIHDPAPNAVVAIGAEETSGNMLSSSQDLAKQLKAAGASTVFLSLPGEDHRGTVQALADEHSELFKDVLAMLEKST